MCRRDDNTKTLAAIFTVVIRLQIVSKDGASLASAWLALFYVLFAVQRVEF
jgi:hypothetical protein